MDVEQLGQDVRDGRVDLERLVDLIGMLQRQLDRANRRIEELESQRGGSPTEKVDQPFSVQAEEQRLADRDRTSRKKNKPVPRGRITKAAKIGLAVRTEQVFPTEGSPELCQFSHTRLVWRLEGGQAVLVAYDIDRGPRNRYGKIDGVLGRSEFGMEIVMSLAYLVDVTRISFDKAYQRLKFFQSLTLTKSQADALLNQLSRAWEAEFDVLCTLLAHSAVVHADETSWSIRSVRAFLSEKARVLFFGVHKDAATLKAILDPETFAGIVISDDAAVYANFSQSQKCWAHLLRKAIKRTLLEPANADYRHFTVTFPNGETKAVGGTNNESERTLRPPAEARKTGRTNKTIRGARRQTILVSVLESLRLHVGEYTLPNLIAEIRHWGQTGRNCFTQLIMTAEQLEERVATLARELAEITLILASSTLLPAASPLPPAKANWIKEVIGSMADFPEFAEVVRL